MLIEAATAILGNIAVGDYARVAAGSECWGRCHRTSRWREYRKIVRIVEIDEPCRWMDQTVNDLACSLSVT